MSLIEEIYEQPDVFIPTTKTVANNGPWGPVDVDGLFSWTSPDVHVLGLGLWRISRKALRPMSMRISLSTATNPARTQSPSGTTSPMSSQMISTSSTPNRGTIRSHNP